MKYAFALLVLLFIPEVLAFPPIASEFYGEVLIQGEPAPPGTNVTIYDQEQNLCGMYVVKQEGTYGLLSCNGDDPDTAADEGGTENERLRFFIDDKPATTSSSPIWNEGSFSEINIDTGVNLAFLEQPLTARSFHLDIIFGVIIFVAALLILTYKMRKHFTS